MSSDMLVNGYRRILGTIYSPKNYYARVRKFLQEYRPQQKMQARFRFMYLRAMVQSVVRLGIIGRERYQYWKLFFWSLIRRPRLFPLAITLSIYGFHFRQVLRRHEKRLRAARA
jgi:hypothetical protein